jgi:hypothetical protein
MTTFRNRLTRRAAERILDHRGDPLDPLARVVDAAAAGYRAAPAPVSTRRLAALPVAALAAAGLLVGGGSIAFAAAQGAVHVPFTGHDHRSAHAPAAPSSTNPGLSRTPGQPSSENTPGASATHLPSASPSPSLEGLCSAYQAGAVPRKATNPAFAALSAAAGGADGVSAYCTGLIGAKPAHPSEAASPTIPPHPTQGATRPRPPRPTQAAR